MGVNRSLFKPRSYSIFWRDEELRSFYSFFGVKLRFQTDRGHQQEDKKVEWGE